MNTCGQLQSSSVTPPANFSPLRANAHMFAAEAGYVGFDVKVKENAVAARNRCPAWDVFVREVGATRGKKVGTMLIAACEAFGPYHY